MREKELRLALICYGGVSLAVYMHGITKEVWRLAAASRAVHADEAASGEEGDGPASGGSEAVYAAILRRFAAEHGLSLRVLADILAGASAGGINAVFLGHALASGRSLDPLTELWLETADVDRLLDPEVGSLSRFAKGAAVPVAWALSNRSGTIETMVEPERRGEVRAKLSNFVRARWFAPPFGGANFTGLLLDAFAAMDQGPAGPPLLPPHQPLDLFVTVTDFHGYPERLRLNSPAEVSETEHRLTLAFRDAGGPERQLAAPAELAFAARATASFPGAFPPFTVGELDAVLAERGAEWPSRADFLARALPRHHAAGEAEQAVLIDGSVLANAPFAPAIAALSDRPARREVDRRFVYIDPKPGLRSLRFGGGGGEDNAKPGFFATIFGALSDIPREQPIRDNLEAIEGRSARIRRMRRIVAAMRPEVEAAIERALGSAFFLLRPTAKRIAGWRARAHDLAAREAGYAYAAYGHLKVSTVVEELARRLLRLGGGGRARREALRAALWRHVEAQRLNAPDAFTARGAREDVVAFLRSHDIAFRSRRLRFLARLLADEADRFECPRADLERLRSAVYAIIGRYKAAAEARGADPALFAGAEEEPGAAIAALAECSGLKALDEATDAELAEALAALPRPDRRTLILSYLGYPFYDVATLPLLQGEGLDEFDPVKVDRIAPDDARAIREGGAAACLKGIQFNNFGAFFSRAWRENDYLWGRLHGADRLIDILASTLPPAAAPGPDALLEMKRAAFRAILDEEETRLGAVPDLIAQLRGEVG
jgi:patatin-related protein